MMTTTRTPPTPPKGTPAPRYIVRYWSNPQAWFGEAPGYRDHVPCGVAIAAPGQAFVPGSGLVSAAQYAREFCTEMNRAEREQGLPLSYVVAITSTGKRVRIGGGAK
jgi:hypothetical protein